VLQGNQVSLVRAKTLERAGQAVPVESRAHPERETGRPKEPVPSSIMKQSCGWLRKQSEAVVGNG
jgi:hypothetical protein